MRALTLALAATLTCAAYPDASAQTGSGRDCDLDGRTTPCETYLFSPPGQDLRLRIRPGEGLRRSERPINTLRELFAELRVCWRPPPAGAARAGMEISVRLSFKTDGNLIGTPRFTYYSKWAPPEVREAYRASVVASFAQCTPLKFTSGMEGAIAGRPLIIRYIDDRNTQRI